MAASSDEEAFEELDPTGRYGRYAAVLGHGSVKKVYRGFDQEEGIEVAWNRVRVRALADRDPAAVDRLHAEVRLLRALHHDHIIGFHKVWLDRDHGVLNFITEVCNSGSLRDYRDRHKRVSVKALKKWARQILLGLDHLHTHDPCIIHRDLNCSNVFINGNTGQVLSISSQSISSSQNFMITTALCARWMLVSCYSPAFLSFIAPLI
jgi:WNK lysine deficient protein kinase